jgi:hypothetical protein
MEYKNILLGYSILDIIDHANNTFNDSNARISDFNLLLWLPLLIEENEVTCIFHSGNK